MNELEIYTRVASDQWSMAKDAGLNPAGIIAAHRTANAARSGIRKGNKLWGDVSKANNKFGPGHPAAKAVRDKAYEHGTEVNRLKNKATGAADAIGVPYFGHRGVGRGY